MSDSNMDIADIVKKCKILLLDIEGTTTSISFVKDKLFPYAEENVKVFLESSWDRDDVKEVVAALRKLSLEDQENKVDGVVPVPGEDASKEDQIAALVNNVKWQMSLDRKTGALKMLQGLVWKLGYDKGDIKGHVYDDVLPALKQWRSVDGQKIYIYSSGSVAAQKLLFGLSSSGDLLPYIDGHFDTAVGMKQDVASYTAIIEKIGCRADEVLFLTDIVKEAEAARGAGMHVALMQREGNAPLPEDIAIPLLPSLSQLTIGNKRKPEQQDEVPAKIPKIETEKDTNFTSVEGTMTEVNNKDESNKMDVDEEQVSNNDTNVNNVNGEVIVEIKIEDVTDIKEPIDATIVDVNPVATDEKPEDGVDETEIKETDKMKSQQLENIELSEPKEKLKSKNVDVEILDTPTVDKSSPTPTVEEIAAVPIVEEISETLIAEEISETVMSEKITKSTIEEEVSKTPTAEETPPIIVTEIEEIISDKPITDIDEIIDDLEPVIEEPPAAEDIESLKNVGEVLEKECDEILSKVQNVTNLENIQIKPLLTTITEETMETDNTDSNDIVDRILDTEMEMAMKPCEDIEVHSVTELTDETKINTKVVSDEQDSKEVEKNLEVEKCDETDIQMGESVPKSNNIETVEEKIIKENELDSKDTTDSCVVDSLKENSLNEPEIRESISDQQVEGESVNLKDNQAVDSKEDESIKLKEVQINGNATEENSELTEETVTEAVVLNGDSNKDELKARLSTENGVESVNGSNGNAITTEQVEEEKMETDIKVKTLTSEEPRTDPVDQPTDV